MSQLWFGEVSLDTIKELNSNTLGQNLGIEFTELAPDYLVATMPVDHRTKQPFGLLHGGASVALAETMGSVATWLAVDRSKFIGVGVEINANHLAMVTQGYVRAECRAIRCSGRLHVWEIKLYDQGGQLCCICRFTCMVVPKR